MAVGRSDVADDPVGFDVPDPDEFRPTGVFCNRHLQSVLASLRIRSALVRRRAAPLLESSIDMVLECGDGVRLAGAYSAGPGEQRPLVVLIHGWEGSADSLYLVSLGARLFAAGYDIFRLICVTTATPIISTGSFSIPVGSAMRPGHCERLRGDFPGAR
jgi:predicted alpha/beta-fold hydrolase